MSVSDFGDRDTMRSQLETNIIFGLRFRRPTQILVSNLYSVETEMISGPSFRDQNPDPVSIRDKRILVSKWGSLFEKGLVILDTEKYIGLRIRLETKCLAFKMQFGSETQMWIRSPFETNYIFGLQSQKVIVIFGFRFRDQVKNVVST